MLDEQLYRHRSSWPVTTGRGARDDAAASGSRLRDRRWCTGLTRSCGRCCCCRQCWRRSPRGWCSNRSTAPWPAGHPPPPAGGGRGRDRRLAGDGRVGADPRYRARRPLIELLPWALACSRWSAPDSCATWRSACDWRCAVSISPARPTACASSSASSYAAPRRAWSVRGSARAVLVGGARAGDQRLARDRAGAGPRGRARPHDRGRRGRARAAGGLHVRDLLSYYESEFKKVPLTELTPAWFLFEHAATSTAARCRPQSGGRSSWLPPESCCSPRCRCWRC